MLIRNKKPKRKDDKETDKKYKTTTQMWENAMHNCKQIEMGGCHLVNHHQKMVKWLQFA